MATITMVTGAKSASILTMGTLANGTYIASSAYNATTNKPLDAVVEVEMSSTATATGFLAVFAQESLDGGTNFSTGPTSGTTTTDEADLVFVGTVPSGTTGTHRKAFSLLSAFGFIPQQVKIVVKNSTGSALASGSVYVSEITGSSV